MKKFLFMACMLPTLGFADANSDKIATLDKQIAEFKQARQKAASAAYIAGSNADQYLGQNWVDYQQAIQKQEMFQRQVKELDAKIQELEKEKAALQK